MENDLDKAVNIKLLLSIFEQLSGLKLISIRVKSFVLERRKTRNNNISRFWGVNRVPYPFFILQFPFIIKNFVMLNRVRLRVDLFPNLDVGRAIFSHMGTV
jgi:hypothetical protein